MSQNRPRLNKKNISPWERAIFDANRKIKELKKAIKVFEGHRDAGDKWPGFEITEGIEKPQRGKW